MLLKAEREQIASYCRKMLQSGLTKGTGGNISIFDRKSGLIAISPSGVPYDTMRGEDVPVVSVDGELVEGTYRPSSELPMHLIFYRRREDIDSVVHTHSPFATTIATLGWDLPAISYLVAFGGVNVRCAPYATFGTEELAEYAYQGMIDRRAVLLANHGFLSGGTSIDHAFNIAEEMEFCCEVFYRAKSIGVPLELDQTEMTKMLMKFESYGQSV